MFSHAWKLLVFLPFTLSLGMPAQAWQITSADQVIVNGTAWAQVDLFTSLSWNNINTICDASGGGTCSAGQLNGWDMEGWTWASVGDLNALFNGYLSAAGVTGTDLLGPGGDTYYEHQSAWAANFYADGWRGTAVLLPTYETIAGWSSSTNQVSGEGYSPNFQYSPDGTFNDVVITDVDNSKGLATAQYGSWFYRSASVEVPAPATLALFATGLAGLGFTRRRKA